MDARHLTDITIDQTQLREIPRREWVAAAPSHALHLGLAVAWVVYLWSIGLFGGGESGAPLPELSFVDEVILLALLGTIMGVFATVGAALANHRATARISAVCAVAMVALGTTCGFAGHSISSWGPTTAAAAGIGFASLAIMSRRAA